MHPLSIFPDLLTFGIFAPFVLRVTVGLFILSLGWGRCHKSHAWTTIFYAVAGVLVTVGLYTQVATIVAIVILKLDFYVDFWKDRRAVPFEKNKYFLYGMAIIVLLSLLVTGPGIFAFDLPL